MYGTAGAKKENESFVLYTIHSQVNAHCTHEFSLDSVGCIKYIRFTVWDFIVHTHEKNFTYLFISIEFRNGFFHFTPYGWCQKLFSAIIQTYTSNLRTQSTINRKKNLLLPVVVVLYNKRIHNPSYTMDESSVDLLTNQSHHHNHNNNNNNNNDERKSENVSDKNDNPIDLNRTQNESLDIDSSDFDFDSLDGDPQNEIENMLLQSMDSNVNENNANQHNSHNNTIDANDFKHSATTDNNNIPTTSNNEMCHSNDVDDDNNDNDTNTKQIKPHKVNDTEPKLPVTAADDNNRNVQDNESNVVSSIIDVNNEHYDSAEEGEPIFDFLGKANEIVCCCVVISIYFNICTLVIPILH